MHYTIQKELLLARLHYLEAMKSKPGSPEIPKLVLDQVKEQVRDGVVQTYLGVESLFNFLMEKLPENTKEAQELSKELLSFMDQ